jgi:hypothetical protein
MKFLGQCDLYDEKIMPHFKAKRFTQKNLFKRQPTLESCGKFFTATNFDCLSKIESFIVFHELLQQNPLYVYKIM